MYTPPSTIKLSASLDRLQDVMAFVETNGKAAGVQPAKLSGLCLAVEEAFVNICNYAFKDSLVEVELACFPGAETFVLEVVDNGQEFNQLSVPEPDISLPLEQRQIGGLGVHFIRNFTDDADWRRENDRNILRFTINLHEGDAHS
jgi:anti-sigma regulatory factor (Ser/Thr protein kinase)